MVCVLPGIFPASIRVAPNSPRALANVRTIPLTIPGIDRGIVTVLNTLKELLPRVLAAISRVGSTL